MYPDLSYFFHDVFGTPYDNWTSIFKTFGLFFATCFVVAGVILWKEFQRYEREGIFKPLEKVEHIKAGVQWGEVISNTLFGFFLGFKIPYIIKNFQEFKLDPASILFSTKGNLGLGLIALAGFFAYSYWRAKQSAPTEDKTVIKKIAPHERVPDLIWVAAIFGIIGARLFSILENFDSFVQDPIGQLFSGSGLTIYGGLILAFAASYYYVKKWGFKPIYVMDLVGPVLILGYGIGRLGCHFSGDGDWGSAATAKPSWWFLPDKWWSFDYPHNVADFYQRGPKLPDCEANFCTYLNPDVFTTPVWEAIASFIIFGFLWSIRKKLAVPGALFFIYAFLNGVERLWIEFYRVNPRYELFGVDLSQAQYIAIALIFIGIIGYLMVHKRANINPLKPFK